MKYKQKRNILLYMMIVLLPTIIGSFLLIKEELNENQQIRVEEANWVASIHASHWNQFVNESVTTLEMLLLTASSIVDDYRQMEPLLIRTHRTEPRYGGIYLLDKDGSILAGSNQELGKNDLKKEDYIQEVIQTKDVIISDHTFFMNNGQNVIGLAAPIVDEKKDLSAMIVFLLRVDYVENIMKVLTPDSELLVMNSQQEVLMNFNTPKEHAENDHRQWISTPIDRLPWSIRVKIADADVKDIVYSSLLITGIIFFLSNIAFLFVKYMLLKREAAIEKKENEAQKLELVGSLAASTAHEIRNPLTGIKGLIQLLSEKYNSESDQLYFNVINQEISRINEIVSEFLILGKPTAQKMNTENLNVILKELHPILSSEANLKNIKLICSVPPEPIFIKCTKDQMKQVILNITKNAVESMDNGGNLTIHLAKKKQVGEIIIQDNGVGIPKEAIEKIFTPFYTSKDTGTGLGLVVCKRLLESFGGQIDVSSEEGIGTIVKITLPLVKEK
ncbi:PAS domain-containing sensor histidine kinase [Bacillus dakarensis]|uniref:PAS domain-containing sensor histidine kinase n=1 Tax=Robertmurraya dakarensis TaxID=1926278 RepID=UPI0009819750|nr:PAS domain-containing sensor histidine kinase [Bacillus dakarensis]